MPPSIPVPEKRKPLTDLQRVRMFDAHKGICVICGHKIGATEKWIDEHIRALELLGTNDMDNRGPAHVDCAKEKTKDDVQRIAKARRQRASYLGAKKSKNPMPGSKDSKWKRKMNGEVEAR